MYDELEAPNELVLAVRSFISFDSFWQPTGYIRIGDPLDASTLLSIAHKRLGPYPSDTITWQPPALTVYENPLRHKTYEFRVQTRRDIVVPSAPNFLRRALGLKQQSKTTRRDIVSCCFCLDLSALNSVWRSLKTVPLRRRQWNTRLTIAQYCLEGDWRRNRVIDGLARREQEADAGRRKITLSLQGGIAVYLAPYSHAVVFKKRRFAYHIVLSMTPAGSRSFFSPRPTN
jgi:hypothetical protein